MDDKTEVVKIIGAMFFQLLCLIAGVTFIGMGTNIYVAMGVLFLLLYSNMARDKS
jgi:uncharacterized membrane protein YczE